MYNPMFITELFRPQEVYSMNSTRQIFDRLAHSSIMRLNESSMDKVTFPLLATHTWYALVTAALLRDAVVRLDDHGLQIPAAVVLIPARSPPCHPQPLVQPSLQSRGGACSDRSGGRGDTIG